MFLGQAPKNMPRMTLLGGTTNFQIFSMLKKWKILNCDFWPKKCSKWPNLDPGVLKIRFGPKRKIWKFSILGLRKISKIFIFLEKFSKIWLKFLKKLKFFPVFLNRHRIATTWSPIWPLQHIPIAIRWEDKAYQNSTFFRFFFSNIFILSDFFIYLPLLL